MSVVLPVYNTIAHLPTCLDSLIAQDLPASEMEIIAVDDGSNDGSGELLDEYARRYVHMNVVHQPNSGWPGYPRNRGIDMSRGEYVFFIDSDDFLGGEALRRMCDFADVRGSDVVLPRMVPADDRPPRSKIWNTTTVDADLRLVFKTLSPQKLFRRVFLNAHNLRFPEGKVRLEDGILLSRAYLLAKRVSVLAGYDFYYKRLREGRGNISLTAIDPVGYLSSVRSIIDNVRKLCGDGNVADEIVLDVYRRKALRRLRAERFLTYRRARRQAWVREVAALAADRIPAELQQRLATRPRLLSEFARRRDVDAVATVSHAQATKERLPVVLSQNRLFLDVDGRVDVAREITDLVRLPDDALLVESRSLRFVRRVRWQAAATGARWSAGARRIRR